MGKNLFLSRVFGPFVPNFGLQNCLRDCYLYQMLEIVVSYHRMELQGNLIIQTQEDGKKPHFAIELGTLGQSSGR